MALSYANRALSNLSAKTNDFANEAQPYANYGSISKAYSTH